MIRKAILFTLFVTTTFLGLAQKKPTTAKPAKPGTKAGSNKTTTTTKGAFNTTSSAAQNAAINAPLKLWYDSPAKYFEEALVLGNGQHGATVFGGISIDKIYLNDATLWSGEPVNANMNPNAYKHLPDVREALADNNYKKAQTLIKKLQGKFSESYAPLGTLLLTFNNDPFISNYYRELNIHDAVAAVKIESNNNTIEREYLVSHPDKIFAIKLTSKQKGALNYSIAFESLLKYTTKTANNVLEVSGTAPIKADPNYLGKKPNSVVFDSKKGTRHRIPFIVKWPGVVKANSISSATICLTDFMATCSDILGKPLQNTATQDSYSLLPLLTSSKKIKYQRTSTIHHSIDGYFAIRKGDWKLAIFRGSGGWSAPTENQAIKNNLPAIQLYNLKEDPTEQNNVHNKYPEIVRALTAELEKIKAAKN